MAGEGEFPVPWLASLDAPVFAGLSDDSTRGTGRLTLTSEPSALRTVTILKGFAPGESCGPAGRAVLAPSPGPSGLTGLFTVIILPSGFRILTILYPDAVPGVWESALGVTFGPAGLSSQ